MKKLIIFLIILLLYFVLSSKNRVCFSDNCLKVEIADTEAERQKGLMFRESLPEDEGMFFVFSRADIYSFWMKNTYIPLDIIWLDENYQVVHIEQAAPCEGECPSYIPDSPAKYVLEANQGFAKNIQIGDELWLPWLLKLKN